MYHFSKPHLADQVKKFSFTRHEPAIRIAVFCLIAVLGISYVVVVNTVATGGFALDDLRERVSALQHENRQLELQAAELTSLSRIQASVADMQLVRTDAIEYLDASAGAVAVETNQP